MIDRLAMVYTGLGSNYHNGGMLQDGGEKVVSLAIRMKNASPKIHQCDVPMEKVRKF